MESARTFAFLFYNLDTDLPLFSLKNEFGMETSVYEASINYHVSRSARNRLVLWGVLVGLRRNDFYFFGRKIL